MNAATKNATVPVADLEALLEAWRRSAAHEREIAEGFDPQRYPASYHAADAAADAVQHCVDSLATVIAEAAS